MIIITQYRKLILYSNHCASIDLFISQISWYVKCLRLIFYKDFLKSLCVLEKLKALMIT